MESLLSMKWLGRERVVAGRRERLAASLKDRSPTHQQLPFAKKTFAHDGDILIGRELQAQIGLEMECCGRFKVAGRRPVGGEQEGLGVKFAVPAAWHQPKLFAPAND